MRLIDADKLKLCYTGTNGLDDKAEYVSIRKMIDLQPTAYDVDKVMQRIDNEVPGLANLQIYKIDEIVKAGMKEN